MKALLLAVAMFSQSAAALEGADGAQESLERQAARMLLVGTYEYEYVPGGEFEKLICGLKVGGVILFDKNRRGPRNIRSQEQLTRLTAKLQELAFECGDGPLLIAVDVEGGVVNRLSGFKALKNLKSHAQLGEGNPRRTYDEASRIARVMEETGLNWTLAPVVDVNLNPKNPVIGRYGRSFSQDPETVARHAQAFIQGLSSFGILNCVKHFPGHGSSDKDSHLGTADVTDTARPDVELTPYRILIDRGIVDCVMTAHIYDRTVDPDWIASLSSRTIQGILRREIGFEGVVVTDDLDMGAVTRFYKVPRAAVLAVRAGSDMLTLANNRNKYDKRLPYRVHEALLEAVESGEIPRERIAAASRRILELKSKLKSEIPRRTEPEEL